MDDAKSKFNEYIKIFHRRKILMILVFSVSLLFLGIGILVISPPYKASSLLAIAEADNVTITSDFQGYLPPASNAALAGETYAYLLQGYPLALKISSYIQANHHVLIPPKDIKESIEATFEKPELLKIEVTARDENNVIFIANSAATILVEENRKNVQSEMASAVKFIEKELVTAKNEMTTTHNQIEEFKDRTGIIDIELEVKNRLDNLTELLISRDMAKTQLQESEAQLDEISKQMNKDKKLILSPIEDPTIVGLKEQLTSLQIDLAAAKTEYSAIHPKIKTLETQITVIENEINNRIEESSQVESIIPDQDYYRDLRKTWVNTLVEVIGLKAKVATLNRLIVQSQEIIAEMPSMQKELQKMVLESGLAENRYKTLLEKLEEAQIEVEKIQGNATIIDLAVEPEPVLSQTFMIIFGILISFIFAIVAGFASEYLNNSLNSANETIAHLNLSFLGMVPFLKRNEEQFIDSSQTGNKIYESFHNICSNLKFLSTEISSQTLLITSAQPRDGKTIATINLALAMAQMGKEVLIIDANLRNPEVHKYFSVDSFAGLTNVLTNEINLDDAIQRTKIKGLTLLPAGIQPPNPIELLESDKFSDVLERLSAKDRIILIDSPAVADFSDATILSANVNGVLLVVEAYKTNRDVALQVKNQLANTGKPLIGFILNKVQ